MTEAFHTSLSEFTARTEAAIAALQAMLADVVAAGRGIFKSKREQLAAQVKQLSVSSDQLWELVYMYGSTDQDDPAAMAALYAVLHAVLTGVSRKPFSGPVVPPVVKLEFDETPLTTAMEYCAWVVKGDVSDRGQAIAPAVKAELTSPLESCRMASNAAASALTRAQASACLVRAGLSGVREVLEGKVARVKSALDEEMTSALSEVRSVADARLALLGRRSLPVWMSGLTRTQLWARCACP